MLLDRGYHHVTVPGKTRHSTQISDVEILVSMCSVLFAPYRGEVGYLIPFGAFQPEYLRILFYFSW